MDSQLRQDPQGRRVTGASAGAASWLPALALGALALIWGYSWVVVKVGLRSSEPLTFAGLRNLFGALVLFAVLAATRRSLRPKALRMTLVLGLFQTTGFFGLTVWALETGGVGRATVLTYTMPFWLLFMAWAFLDEKVRGAEWLATALALLGLVLIVKPWQLEGLTSCLLAVAGGVSWAASAVVAKLLHRRHAVDLLSLTAWQMLLGSIPLVVVAALASTESPQWSASFIWSLAYTALLASALAYVLWMYILRTLPAGYAGLSTLLIPVTTVFFAWLQLGEQPGTSDALGIAVIVAALGIIRVRQLLSVPRPEPKESSTTGAVIPGEREGS